jgi:hypothetical protein
MAPAPSTTPGADGATACEFLVHQSLDLLGTVHVEAMLLHSEASTQVLGDVADAGLVARPIHAGCRRWGGGHLLDAPLERPNGFFAILAERGSARAGCEGFHGRLLCRTPGLKEDFGYPAFAAYTRPFSRFGDDRLGGIAHEKLEASCKTLTRATEAKFEGRLPATDGLPRGYIGTLPDGRRCFHPPRSCAVLPS